MVGMTVMGDLIVIGIRISRNFSLLELTKSSTATRLGIDNTPSQEVIDNLEFLALRILQHVRDHYGRAVTINSGFRCLDLNRKLGSGDRSQHVTGNAADMEISGVDNYELACWIRDNLEFDQLILEFYTGEPSSGWVHVSLKPLNNRMECLTVTKQTTRRGLIK